MAQTGFTPIQLYSSSTTGNTPAAADLLNSSGGSELAINIFDGKLFYKDSSGNVQVIGWKVVPVSAGGTGQTSYTDGQLLIGNSTGNTLTKATLTAGSGVAITNGAGAITISATGGTGDVVGPSSATDNAIARFDTTTGKLIQNSVVTVSDTGAIAGATTITDLNYLDFNTAYATTLGAGQLGWNGNDTLGLGMIGGNVIQHIGEDQFFYVKASSAITKGQLCMFTGAVGASGVLTAAPSNSLGSPQYVMGFAAEDIALNAFGLVQCYGTLRNVNTSAYADGDVLYYNSAVTGGTTNVYPTSGFIITVAAVTKGGSVGGGSINIRITVTQRITASTGISVAQTSSGSIITNTAPDQVVSLTGAGTTSISGTYPSFTITSNDAYVGTVTSVGGTGTVNGITLTGTVTSSGNLTLGGTLSGIGNSQLTNSTISGVALGGSLFNLTAGTGVSFSTGTTYNGSAAITINATGTGGTVTSVAALTLGTTGTDLSSTVANGTTTPVITLNVPTASAANRGALSSTDWSTFNGKQAALVSGTNIKTVNGTTLLGSGDLGTIGVGYGGTGQTSFTAGRVLYGNGASAISSSASLFFDGTNLGVGTASPSSYGKLAVVGSDASAVYSQVVNTNASGLALLQVQGTGAKQSYFWQASASYSAYHSLAANNAGIYGTTNLSYEADGAFFQSWWTGGSERLRLFSSGGFSLGNTTDPGATNLSVTGTIAAGGTISSTATETVRILADKEISFGNNTASLGIGEYFASGTTSLTWYYRTGGATLMTLTTGGNLTITGATATKASGTTWANPSDIRLKENVTDYSKGLAELMQVNVKEWTYNGKGGTTEGMKGLGVIADEIMIVLPNTVENYQAKLNADDEADTDIKKFDATEITWLMLNSIKEQQKLITSLIARLDALEG